MSGCVNFFSGLCFVQPTIAWRQKWEIQQKSNICEADLHHAPFKLCVRFSLALALGASSEETGGLANFGSFHGNTGAM
jgi:hypothetical protein